MDDGIKSLICIGVIVAIIAGCSVTETKSNNDAILKLVEAGVDPREAKCVVKGEESDCVIKIDRSTPPVPINPE